MNTSWFVVRSYLELVLLVVKDCAHVVIFKVLCRNSQMLIPKGLDLFIKNWVSLALECNLSPLSLSVDVFKTLMLSFAYSWTCLAFKSTG